MLRAAFADWDIEELVEYENTITEGTGHLGRSALIGMVAGLSGPQLANGGGSSCPTLAAYGVCCTTSKNASR